MKVRNSLGLVFVFSPSGALQCIEADPIRISLTPSSALGGPGANLYLRKRGSSTSFTPLLGAAALAQFRVSDTRFEARGTWEGLTYACCLQLGQTDLSWRWRVEVASTLDHPVELDLLYVQDLGLQTLSSGLTNEYYVSQYIERRVLQDPRYGAVVCCRQNARASGGHPWVMIACPSRAVAASTDGSQVYGRSFRGTGEAEAMHADVLGGELAGESSVVALQERPFVLGPAESHTSTFVAAFLADHPQASSEGDLARLPPLIGAFEEAALPAAGGSFTAPARARLAAPRLLQAEDLSEPELQELFGNDLRHVETKQGTTLSFFADGPRHVVLRAKELSVDRPHGHIMQASSGYVPDETVMSTTAFACGVFNSHLTQGNTNFNTLLSVCTQPTAPTLDSGQRILVQLDGGEYLLGVPSAFEMGLNHCRWIYKVGSAVLQVCTWTTIGAPLIHLELRVLRGEPLRMTLVHHFDPLHGWAVAPAASHEFVATPKADSVLAGEFPGAQFRMIVNSPQVAYARCEEALGLAEGTSAGTYFALEVTETSAFCMSFVGEVQGRHETPRIADAHARRRADCEAAASAWRSLSRELTVSGPGAIEAVREILPWYGMNALIHFLTPYGLEQFSGAAWGTRDVCQGPIDLLLSQERYAEAKQVLRTVFSNQSPDGGWPQWWMFDSYRHVRADSAHGDVIYWCMLALCSYIEASGDFAILAEHLPYFQDPGAAPVAEAPLIEHVDRIIDLVIASFVPSTALVRFGGGDWNDSLQPVSKDLAERLISSWTVQMCYQAFREYGEVCERAGDAQRARKLKDIAGRILADFNRHLVRDGVVAGYGLVGEGRSIDVLLHPTDTKTGVKYSLLPMNRGVISGAFSKEQAERHLDVMSRHLEGPDGARLMDRPLRYTGGLQTIFQRAESSTYFGREIGLMYVHEHLRFAETHARMGRPDAFLKALRQAIPVAYEEVVPQGDLRQANCYYSSSDVHFRSRYEADERYDEVVAGRMPLKGGWRVYSSGPGIFLGLVISRLLGIRMAFGRLILDPVLPRALDGLQATMRLRGHPVTFVYRVAGRGFGPQVVTINGQHVPFEREDNPYREGGAVVPLADFEALLSSGPGRVDIQL